MPIYACLLVPVVLLCHSNVTCTKEDMKVASIDPGVTGAVALVNSASKEVEVFDLPTLVIGKRNTIDPYALGGIFNVHQPSIVVIEHVVPIGSKDGRKRGIKTTGDFMYGAGVLFGVAGGNGLEVDFVPPATWKRRLNLLGMSKEASRSLAIRTFPQAAHLLKRKKDKDRAEALLIAHDYILRHGGYEASARRQRKPSSSLSLASTTQARF